MVFSIFPKALFSSLSSPPPITAGTSASAAFIKVVMAKIAAPNCSPSVITP